MLHLTRGHALAVYERERHTDGPGEGHCCCRAGNQWESGCGIDPPAEQAIYDKERYHDWYDENEEEQMLGIQRHGDGEGDKKREFGDHIGTWRRVGTTCEPLIGQEVDKRAHQ